MSVRGTKRRAKVTEVPAIASEASEVADEAPASANAAAHQQTGLAARRAAATNHIAAERVKKQLKPNEPKDRQLDMHEKKVAKIKTASIGVLITMISMAQLLQAANIAEKDIDISKVRDLAIMNALNDYEEKKKNLQKMMEDLFTSGQANFKLVREGKCDPFENEKHELQVPAFSLGYKNVPTIDLQNDEDIKACFKVIAHNMNVKETSVHKAYSVVMSNVAMMQLAHATLTYRKIHNDLNTDAALHKSLFKLAIEAGFEAGSESYFKSIVLASETYYDLATTFHMLRYATITISTWRSDFRMIRDVLCDEDANNDKFRDLLVAADKDENEDVAQRRIDDFLNKPK